jgi:hypothetical protein
MELREIKNKLDNLTTEADIRDLITYIRENYGTGFINWDSGWETNESISEKQDVKFLLDSSFEKIEQIKKDAELALATHEITYSQSHRDYSGFISYEEISTLCYFLSEKRVQTVDGAIKNVSGKNIKSINKIKQNA